MADYLDVFDYQLLSAILIAYTFGTLLELYWCVFDPLFRKTSSGNIYTKFVRPTSLDSVGPQ